MSGTRVYKLGGPALEDPGLIAPLGRWVLEHAVAEVADWAERYPEVPLRVAVNVSGQQLARPEFLHEVRAALDASDLPPERLGLEITESILINAKCHRMGVWNAAESLLVHALALAAARRCRTRQGRSARS